MLQDLSKYAPLQCSLTRACQLNNDGYEKNYVGKTMDLYFTVEFRKYVRSSKYTLGHFTLLLCVREEESCDNAKTVYSHIWAPVEEARLDDILSYFDRVQNHREEN